MKHKQKKTHQPLEPSSNHEEGNVPESVEIPLDSLPEEIRNKLGSPPLSGKTTIRIQQVQRTMRSAPLPDAEEARAYENICPGAFNRLLKIQETRLLLAEKELDTQHMAIKGSLNCKESEIAQNALNERRGQWMALPVALTIIGMIGFAIYRHADWKIIDALAAIFTFGSLGAVFLNRSSNKTSTPSREQSSKAQEAAE